MKLAPRSGELIYRHFKSIGLDVPWRDGLGYLMHVIGLPQDQRIWRVISLT